MADKTNRLLTEKEVEWLACGSSWLSDAPSTDEQLHALAREVRDLRAAVKALKALERTPHPLESIRLAIRALPSSPGRRRDVSAECEVCGRPKAKDQWDHIGVADAGTTCGYDVWPEGGRVPCLRLGYAREKARADAAERERDDLAEGLKEHLAWFKKVTAPGAAQCVHCGEVPAAEENDTHWSKCKAHPAKAAVDSALSRATAAEASSSERGTALSLVSGALADAGMAVGPASEFGERVRDLAKERDEARAEQGIAHQGYMNLRARLAQVEERAARNAQAAQMLGDEAVRYQEEAGRMRDLLRDYVSANGHAVGCPLDGLEGPTDTGDDWTGPCSERCRAVRAALSAPAAAAPAAKEK